MTNTRSKSQVEAQERIKKKRELEGELSGQFMADRLAAMTQSRVKVKAPKKKEIEAASPNDVGSGGVPDPQESRPLPPKKVPTPRLAAAVPTLSGAKKTAPRSKSKSKDPRRMKQFLEGQITLGELEGISKQAQNEIAKLGHRNLLQGKLKDARKVFAGLVALDPRDSYFRLAMGSVAQRQRQNEEAERHYSDALVLDPKSVHAYANRGEVRLLLGKTVEGAKDLFEAVKLDPQGKEEVTRRAQASLNLVVAKLKEVGFDFGAGQEKEPKKNASRDQAARKRPASSKKAPPRKKRPAARKRAPARR